VNEIMHELYVEQGLPVCCIIKIQKVAEGNAEKCICILHKNAELKERVTL